MKVAELEGAQLDYWVAIAEGVQILYWDGKKSLWIPKPDARGDDYALDYAPSTNWAQGGPIIERERISVCEDNGYGWDAYIRDGFCGFQCSTPLVAAMRAYVLSKFGEEVEDQRATES